MTDKNREPSSYGIELPVNDTRQLADELRELIALFPRDLALHRGFLTMVASELDYLRAMLSRQRNAAKRCAEIAREEARVYEPNVEDQGAMMACNRIADRIEGEVVT